jgi:hypothetical protein
MVDALKKLDRKFLIFAGCIILLPILLIIFLAIIQGCSNRKMTYENYEQKMISATERYLKNNVPTEESEMIVVSLNALVEKSYIKTSKKALDDSCTGEVTVRRNGSSVESNNGGFLNYTVSLNCENYNTVHLFDKITSEVVTSDSGLYLVGENYIFKGNKVNNYINFFGQDYRIMSINKDGIIKLIKSEPEGSQRIWDNKFNSEANATYGKSIYKDSVILGYLLADYKNSKKISKAARQHIVAQDVCVGKRSSDNYSISKDIDCSEVLENQVISLINVSDYAMASTDPDCDSTASRSCRNYNYLSTVALSTWTLNSSSDNTYDVFFISDGLQESQKASSYNEYSIVIYIDGNELYTTGTGSAGNPYIVK